MEIIDRISGLDKLLELLTEHCRKHYGFKEKDDIKIDNDSCNFHLYHKGKRYFSIQPEKLIFKDFGFIQWLVENDKIDLKEKIISCLGTKSTPETMDGKIVPMYYSDYKSLLMLLSIQDNPISFLISILK